MVATPPLPPQGGQPLCHHPVPAQIKDTKAWKVASVWEVLVETGDRLAGCLLCPVLSSQEHLSRAPPNPPHTVPVSESFYIHSHKPRPRVQSLWGLGQEPGLESRGEEHRV